MTPDILHSVNESFTYFLKKIWIHAWELINKHPENRDLLNNLCSSLPLLALECRKNNINSETKLWLRNIMKS